MHPRTHVRDFSPHNFLGGSTTGHPGGQLYIRDCALFEKRSGWLGKGRWKHMCHDVPVNVLAFQIVLAPENRELNSNIHWKKGNQIHWIFERCHVSRYQSTFLQVWSGICPGCEQFSILQIIPVPSTTTTTTITTMTMDNGPPFKCETRCSRQAYGHGFLHMLILGKAWIGWLPSRTAQGGVGSFKDIKPIGDVSCCDEANPLMERRVAEDLSFSFSLFASCLSLFNCLYLSI